MLTKKELLSFNPEYGASSLKKRSQIKLYNSHLEALDEIDRLKAELAAQVGHETTKRVLIGNIDDFGAISQCEKCYKMLDVFMKFCPNCGRKIEGGDKV